MKIDGIAGYEGEILGSVNVRRGIARFTYNGKEVVVLHTDPQYATGHILCEMAMLPAAEEEPPMKQQCLQTNPTNFTD